jgi:uncharacterized protein
MKTIYHQGNRNLQDHFDSRKLADRLTELTVHDEITDRDRAFIQARDMFFISTIDADGNPTVSYKGGQPGFVKIVDEKTIAFPDYDGNGMFLTTGNITVNNEVGLLFIDFEEPMRLRLHGQARVDIDSSLLNEYPEAKSIITITIRNLFINCPRYIHKHKKLKSSEFVPTPKQQTPIPDWKEMEQFKDVLPKGSKDK